MDNVVSHRPQAGNMRHRQRCRVSMSFLIILALTACGPKTRWDHTPTEQHIVRTGETLYAIAWRYDKDPRDLARWNNLGSGALIHAGDAILLRPPAGMAESGSSKSSGSSSPGTPGLPPLPAQSPPAWQWPAPGRIVVDFGKRPGSGTGVLIAGREGDSIRAAAAGRVVYSGSGLIGYGRLIILKHNDTYLSAYGHNATLLVKEGQTINKGQQIATMGEGPGQEPRLHFEIRRNGKPVDPRRYLPAR